MIYPGRCGRHDTADSIRSAAVTIHAGVFAGVDAAQQTCHRLAELAT
ncbi:MAG: hypothetical protein K0A93_03165 [Desulfuromonadaceae bacterium]|nr:hypothetical protein [Desulfuromonadaceae bacterium]